MRNIAEHYSPDYTVFDLETTGLSGDAKIVEISGVKIRGRKVASRFSTLVNPNSKIPIEATTVHHINDDMVKDSPTIDIALKQFREFIGDDMLVGHNIDSFDLRIIDAESKTCGTYVSNEYRDSVILARKKLPHLYSRSLQYLAAYYGVPYKNAHRGLSDSMITYHVYEHLVWTPVPTRECNIGKCPKCDSGKLKLILGKYGKFFGCSNYPTCNYTEPY